MGDQLHTPATLPLRKELLVPLKQEGGRAPDLVWMWWQRERVLALARNQTLVIQPVA
jgi:hypothetical protein